MKHQAIVKNHKLIFGDNDRFKLDVAKNEGDFVTITVDKPKKRRSNDLNAYYWGAVIKILSDFTGFEKEEMHEVLKLKFLLNKKQMPDGKWIEYTKSTKGLNSEDMIEYVEQIKRWATSELDVYIPDPNEL